MAGGVSANGLPPGWAWATTAGWARFVWTAAISEHQSGEFRQVHSCATSPAMASVTSLQRW